jgi:hypothetical protein
MRVNHKRAKLARESGLVGGELTQGSGTVARSVSRRWWWGGGAVVIAAAIGAGLALWQTAPAPQPIAPIPLKLESLPSAAANNQTPPQPVAVSPQPAPMPPQGPALPKNRVVANPVPQGDVPRFDIVRVDPTGHAVLAGQAAPESEVTVYDGERAIGRTKADRDGNWVMLMDEALPPGKSQLSLSAKGTDGTVLRSAGTVAMLVPERGGAPSQPARAGTAVATLAPGREAAEALSPPSVGVGDGRLSLDFIQYDTGGDVILEGRAAPGDTVGAYIGGREIGTAKAGADGKWQIVPKQNVSPGRYKLVIEAKNNKGKQVARVASPFERATLPEPIPVGLVIVQPGNSLWRIARRSYGHGIRYTEIYHANSNQISDPSLIYPGQLLHIPAKS